MKTNKVNMFLLIKMEGGISMLRHDVNEIDDAAKFKIGQRIQETRVDSGIKAIDLATALDISKDYYSRIENGRAICTVEKLYQISQYLDVTADYLLLGNTESVTLIQITSLLVGLNEKQLVRVKNVLTAMLE